MPGAKGKSGRKKKDKQTYTVQELLSATAVEGAKYLRDVITGVVKRPSWPKIRIAEYSIDHEIGKAKIKTEITGAGGRPLTIAALIELATRGDNGNRELTGRRDPTITEEGPEPEQLKEGEE